MLTVGKIVLIPVNQIKPYHRNVRKNDKTIEKLVDILPKVGFNVPLVLDKMNVIVKGHSRWAAAIKLGMTEIPCVYTEADEETTKLDRIADNKIQEYSKWDMDELTTELSGLNTDFDLSILDLKFDLSGFESIDTDKLNDVEEDDGLKLNPKSYQEVICDKCGNAMYFRK